MARFTLDPNSPPELTVAERARLEALSDAEITASALADPDNPPLSAWVRPCSRSRRRATLIR